MTHLQVESLNQTISSETLPENLNDSFYPSVDCHLKKILGLFNKLTGDASERWGKYCICQPRVISAL